MSEAVDRMNSKFSASSDVSNSLSGHLGRYPKLLSWASISKSLVENDVENISDE